VKLLRLVLALTFVATLHAQNQLVFDATHAGGPPAAASYTPQFATAPGGHTFALNDRYLIRDGKPWLPVMGEFHFSRVPRDQWDEQLLKMKSAGVDIISTYVFWIHHEELEGQWDWTGDRDLRAFIQACAAHHLAVIVRVGPWAHGEARNGGLPDWLLAKAKQTRRDDPTYLPAVDTFFTQIAHQLDGFYFKDGGPIVGIQIENEYSQRGPGAGEQHLLTLKHLALQHGMDAPFYTLTAWDNAVFPHGEFVLVFGGYPDAPWDDSLRDLPPQEVYAFRFHTRVSANMGAIGATGTTPPPAQTYDLPFLTAEVGGGIEDTYHRRPIISPDDVAAMMPVLLGSGANLYGSYMFQGGINPEGKRTTLQESLATGYPNDLPVKSYDFQAPLGETGDTRPSLGKLRLMNLFLNDFGDQLAPMTVVAPDLQPSAPTDLAPARAAVRTNGHSGFLFFNNYVRGPQPMPARPNFQTTIKLAGKEFRLPAQPITLPAGAYGIWPFGLDLGSIHLISATAQLVAHTHSAGGDAYFFTQTPGVLTHFLLGNDAAPKQRTPSPSLKPFYSQAGTHLYLLSQQQAESALRVHASDGDHLVLTPAEAFADGTSLWLEYDRPGPIATTFLPSLPSPLNQTLSVPAAPPALILKQTHQAQTAPPVESVTIPGHHPRTVATAPTDAAFDNAATWQLQLPTVALAAIHPGLQPGLHNLTLHIDYVGDVARLSADHHLLDDNFYNGTAWSLGLSRWHDTLASHPLELQILPLRQDAPIFLEAPFRPSTPQRTDLRSVKLSSQYLFHVDLAKL
jgi:beta-galactosidase